MHDSEPEVLISSLVPSITTSGIDFHFQIRPFTVKYPSKRTGEQQYFTVRIQNTMNINIRDQISAQSFRTFTEQ
jgi:hypothetical protein